MALIKRKTEEPMPEVAEAAAMAATDVEQPAALAIDAVGEVEDAIEAPAEVESPAEEPASLDDSDALLSLFGGEDHGAADRELIVGMAGEVEVADLVDELRTVAAALRIVERKAS